MLTNLAEIKKLLQITDTTNDDYIEMMIPMAIEYACGYIKHHFTNKMTYEGTFIFEDNKITTGFDTIEYLANQDIYVWGTNYNDGFVTIASIDAGDIYATLNFTPETIECKIYGVKYPQDTFFKKIIAEMIYYNL